MTTMVAVDNGKNGATAASQVVAITTTRNVAPATPKCVLTTFDLPFITFEYNQKLLLYRLADAASDFPDVVVRMSSALSDALACFYPLAGRIRQDDKDGTLSIDGHHSVEVIEAATDQVSVDNLTGDRGVLRGSREGHVQLLMPYTGVMNLEGLHKPLLAVQLTRLKDGMAVGCAFNHAVLDGTSTWHFMSSWAELCRDAGTPSLLPVYNRAMARSVRVNLPLPPSAEAHEKTNPNGPKKPLVTRVFSFPTSGIARAKAAANAALHDGAKPFSSFQSLGAHIWRAVSRTRALSPSDITVFSVFANCRARLNPPVPAAYFGNLVQAVFTSVPAGILLGSPPELAAGLLQKAIDEHDAGAITRRMEEYEDVPKLYHYSGPNCVVVGRSPRFRVYDVDFGFGRAEHVGSGGNNMFDRMVYLYPGRGGDGDIDVELSLQPGPMERLEKDDDFLLMGAA